MTQPYRYTPQSYFKSDRDMLRVQLDRDMPLIHSAHQLLDSTAIKAPNNGEGFNGYTGTTTVTGSKTGIQSTLSVISRVVASIDNGATPTNFTLTARVSPSNKSQFDLFVWQPTSSSDTTPIAATSAVTVHWWLTGSVFTTGT